MTQITPTLRKEIDSAASALIAVAEKLKPTSPMLADIYKALGQGLDSSHYQNEGERHLNFELPAGCEIALIGKKSEFTSGPALVRVTVREGRLA